jgi:hypothetical protein
MNRQRTNGEEARGNRGAKSAGGRIARQNRPGHARHAYRTDDSPQAG